MPGGVRVWLVERTFSDDELNLVVLTYATPDGQREFRKERALPSFSGGDRETPVSLVVDPDDLADVVDPETRERYSGAVDRLQRRHDADDRL